MDQITFMLLDKWEEWLWGILDLTLFLCTLIGCEQLTVLIIIPVNNKNVLSLHFVTPSVFSRCWLGDRKDIWPGNKFFGVLWKAWPMLE